MYNFYRIAEISNEVVTGETYVLVEFWPDRAAFQAEDPPVLVNDFIMRLRVNGSRIVTNGRGFLKRLSDGVFIDPATLELDDQTVWEKENVSRDLPAEIHTNIEAYADRAAVGVWTGDHTGDASKQFFINGQPVFQGRGQTVHRDQQDRNGATTRPDVVALVGTNTDRDAPAAPSLFGQLLGWLA